MGSSFSKHQKSISSLHLNIGTLNYAGIIKSPYQFFQNYSKQEIRPSVWFCLYYLQQKGELEEALQKIDYKQDNSVSPKLEDIASKIINMEMDYKKRNEQNQKSLFSYFQKKLYFKCFSIIDKTWKQDRYSPLYNWYVGVKDNEFLQNRQEFQNTWKQVYQKNKNQVFELVKKTTSEIHKEQIYQKYLKQNKKYVIHKKNEYQTHIRRTSYEQEFKDLIIGELMLFDYIAYKAILASIIQKDVSSDLQKRQIRQRQISRRSMVQGENYEQRKEQSREQKKEQKKNLRDLKRYWETMLKKFSKTYLDEDKKVQKVIQLFNDNQLDVLFLQEANETLLKKLQQHMPKIQIVRPLSKIGAFSAIIINHKKFQDSIRFLDIQNSILIQNIQNRQKPTDQRAFIFDQKQNIQFNINKNTVIQAIGNIILISTHLTSHKDLNKKQKEELDLLLQHLKKFDNLHIVLGGDLNSDDVKLEKSSSLYIFPDTKGQGQKQPTTCKTRSFLQAQTSKGNKSINQTKNYLISSSQITNKQILQSSSKQKKSSQSQYLPTDQYPFDTFLVKGKVYIPEFFSASSSYYQENFEPEKLTDKQLINIYKRTHNWKHFKK